MTKDHEEYFEGSIDEHIKYFKSRLEKDQVGELSFVLEGVAEEPSATTLDAQSLLEFREAPPSQAAKFLAKYCSMSRDEAYELIKTKGE